jgi:sugar lactone lactonase YvrE
MRHRGWCAAGFTVLLIVGSASPVLADPSSDSSSGAQPASSSNRIPSSAEFTAALQRAEAETSAKEAALKAQLATPQAAHEREASRIAYASLSSTQAQGLLLESFPTQLREINADPARMFSDLDVEKLLGTHGALVRTDEGGSAIVESSLPVESAVGGEGKRPVDLSLRRAGQSFAPRNPLTELTLPASAEGAIQTQSGVEIKLAASDDHGGVLLGNQNLFYPETEEQTDTLVSPLANGVEVFEQLRSPQSPEQFRFALNLPQGATLRPSDHNGAEVVSSTGELIGEVPAPSATDAQGLEIPVTLDIEGNSILVEVRHRSREVAYPILLDPRYNEGYESPSFIEWSASENAEYYLGNAFVLSAISQGSNHNYAANTWGQWAYSAPGETAYIEDANFSSIDFYVNSCATAHPHGYVGIYNVNTGYINLKSYNSGGAVTNDAYWDGWGGSGTRYAIVGIGTGGSSSKLKCAHELYVGAVTVQENDPEAPTINWVSGVPSGWFDPAKAGEVTIHATDPGFGVREDSIEEIGSGSSHHSFGCNGMAGSRCSREASWTISPSYAGGEHTLQVSAEDPTGKAGTWSTTTKVDNLKPEINLGGQLAYATEEEGTKGEENEAAENRLSLPVYNMHIEAIDGSNSSPGEKQSGAKKVEILLDNVLQKKWEESCPASSCKMEKSYSLTLLGLESGKHKLTVVAEDQVGHLREREIEFEYIPATGMKNEYVMQRFPLSKDVGGEEDPHQPELAVNVMNGNLVYRQRDVDVEGPNVDLELERFYNSQLPNSENTEWGDGWTLAQTPTLELEESESPPTEATMVEESGVIQSEVGLPTKVAEEQFDPQLQATITKESGGYEVEDQSGQRSGSLAFDSAGEVGEKRTSGYAKVEYEYEGGHLSEIAVDDPSSVSLSSEEVAELEEIREAEAPEPPTYTSSFGTSGSGNGQFEEPAGIAIDAKGNIWVADENHYKVQKFNSAGEYQSSFGSSGSGNGQFSRPTDIAIDAKGNLWVTDASNDRIEEFNEKGEFLKAVGSTGSGNGQFNGPEAIAIDAKGNLWVGDTYNHRLQELNEKGEFIKVVSSYGTGAGQMIEPTGIDIGPAGNVWVADWGNNRVEEFSESGTFIRQFGFSGTGNGQFDRPDVIDVDTRGNVWVGDQKNSRIQEFNQSGEYIAQFGTSGSGVGQFEFAWPMGIATDSTGHIWISDTENNRVQKWTIPRYAPTYSSTFGSVGGEEGQFEVPQGVAVDSAGHIWIADSENNRIEEFNEEGEFLKAVGSYGSGNGQFWEPFGIAIDGAGNIWVTDSNNHRVEKFNSKGEFLLKFGTGGSGNGQFAAPSSLAVDSKGNVWVADTGNNRVQKFNEKGEFIKVVGAGQLSEDMGIAIDSSNNVFVSSGKSNTIVKFNEAGEKIEEFGSAGSGAGQFQHPGGLVIDPTGTLWVIDQVNRRVEGFSKKGEYISQFGKAGSGPGEFEFHWWDGIASDHEGNLFVVARERVEKWLKPQGGQGSSRHEGSQGLETDPKVEIDVASGLVESVDGEEAGENGYEHEGNLLTAYSGSEGETEYEYDEHQRLKKVTLPNETYGEVAYDEIGRVKSVTVSIEGTTAKKTTFEYSDESRQTIVTSEGELSATYAIGADGSILKWWSAKVPPEIEELEGGLWTQRGEVHPESLTSGDQALTVHAHAVEGIKSIAIVANGNDLVAEATCEETKCVKLEKTLVTETEDWPPGILEMEVIVTDRLDQVSSQRFWDNIPYDPPKSEAEEELEPPTFEEIKNFREEFGLDLDLKGNESALSERIFALIASWHNPNTTEGEIARAAAERWGAPLRPIDVAEMEEREAYVAHDGPLIEQWGEAHALSTYAGYYVDNRAGGVIRVGFTENAASLLAQLKAEVPLAAPSGKVGAYTAANAVSHASLESSLEAISSAWLNSPALAEEMSEVGLRTSGNLIEVGATNVAHVREVLVGLVGSGVPLSVEYASSGGEFDSGRYKPKGKMLAGMEIQTSNERCTAGPGAWKTAGTKPNGESIKGTRFLLTAGHCAAVGENIYRGVSQAAEAEGQVKIGHGSRSGLPRTGGYETDGSAVVLENPNIVPNAIFRPYRQPLAFGPPEVITNNTLCFSGVKTGDIKCGPVLAYCGWRPQRKPQEPSGPLGVLWSAEMGKPFETEAGDSGAPVWDAKTKAIVGVVSGSRVNGRSMVAPLLPLAMKNSTNRAPGILAAVGGDLTVETAE